MAMRIFFWVLIVFALTLSAFSCFGAFDPEGAGAYHNGPWLPGDIGPVQHRALERGYVTYCFESVAANYPNFRSQVREVADVAGTVGGIASYETSWGAGCDLQNIMPPDSVFNATCGSGAAACIQFWTDPEKVYYRRALGYTDWKSAVCHEGGAANSGHSQWLHEQYDDINFRSLGKTWTCMDFGTGVWQMPAWDRDRIWNADVPDRPASVSFNADESGIHIGWSQDRFDGGIAHLHAIPVNSNATRVSIAWGADPDANPEWIGDWVGPEYALAPYGDGGFSLSWDWAGCLFIRAENAPLFWVPQVSSSRYWALAGCTFAPPAIPYAFPGKTGDATCIAWKESRFDPLASHVNTNGSIDRGLFEINSVNVAFVRSMGYQLPDLYDPYVNARVAAGLQAANGWRIWSTARLCGV